VLRHLAEGKLKRVECRGVEPRADGLGDLGGNLRTPSCTDVWTAVLGRKIVIFASDLDRDLERLLAVVLGVEGPPGQLVCERRPEDVRPSFRQW
jgi:hypothetical protein